MTNTLTQEPLRVRTDQGAPGPWLKLPESQVPRVRALLDENRVYYWRDEHAYSVDDNPEFTFLYFGREGDAGLIQRLLDSAP